MERTKSSESRASTTGPARGAGPVKSALRTLELLEVLASFERPASFTELLDALGYPRSSLHGLLATLEEARWVERHADTQDFTLGLKAWEVGTSYSRVHGLQALALPSMERLRDELGETVQLAELDGLEVLYLAKVDGPQALRLDSAVGSRLEAYATGVGKALLAALPREEQRRRLMSGELRQITPHTRTDVDELLDHLAEITRLGYAIDDQERTLGAACVAVPVRDRSGRVRAAMSVSAPVVRFGPKVRDRAVHLLSDAVENLRERLPSSSI